MRIVAKTLAGLEEILAKEIEQIGGINIAIGNRMVSYLGDKEMLYKSNLWLRTALRVLVPVEKFNAGDPDDLYNKVKAIDWSKYVEEGQTISIDNTIYSENFRNSRYAIYRAKDAICDWFVEHNLKRPKVAVATADVQLNLHITDDPAETGDEPGSACTISLDASGDALYKRGYKEYQTDAPISEVLAAGILLKAGYDGTRDLYDPMCGSGTFLIEAALIATNTPAGLYRKGFGFMRWTLGELAYDEEMWQNLYDDDSKEKEFLCHIYGSDISKVAIDATRENVRAAGLAKYISLEVKDFEELEKSPFEESGIVVMNPPYGKRLFTDVPSFYKMIGNQLKNKFQGCEAWVISSDDPDKTFSATDPRTGFKKEGTPFDFVGLKPSLKIDMNNGGIPCQLRKYEMFAGKFEDFRKDGNELDKQSADMKQDNSRYDRVRKPRREDGDKPRRARRDGDSRKDDGEKKRFYDKDGKAYERGHKVADRKPRRTESSATERKYTVDKDGNITAGKPKAASDKKSFDKKPFNKDKKFDKDKKPAGKKTFDKDRKPATETAERKPRRREYDPNRPMFPEGTDLSSMVLDLSGNK